MFHRTNLKFKEKLQPRDYFTRYIILHHTAITKPHTVEDVHLLHQRKGMAGIGYHFFISKEGEIYEGRPYDTIGAHAKDFNAESVGIGFEGDFNKETMSEKQLNASVMLISLIILMNSAIYPDYPALKMCCDLKEGTDDPGKNFPFNELKRKVEECKKYLWGLFGYQSYLDDQREELGDFDYERIFNLLNQTV